jgi:hypothetical protein
LGLDTLLLQDGPVEKIVDRCRRYILTGAKAERLVMFFNDVSIHTPPQNVHAAIAAVRHFGKLPIQDRPRSSFQVPEFEPFESFMKRYRATQPTPG